MINDTEKSVNREENKTPLTIDTLSANTYQTNLKFTKSTGGLIDKKPTEPENKSEDSATRKSTSGHIIKKTQQTQCEIRLENKIKELEQYIEDSGKQKKELEEINQKLINDYAELGRMFEDAKKLAREADAEEVIEVAEEKCGLITPEEAENLRKKIKELEGQQKESLKNTNSIDFSKSYSEIKLQERDKQITRLEEQNKKWETNFNKLLERYVNLNTRLEKDKELAKQDGRNEVKWNWEKYVSKDDVIYIAEENYGMITKEDKEELETKIKSLEEKNKQLKEQISNLENLLKKQLSETSDALSNSQEQISELNAETKPITGEQINIALVFLTVVSWIGLLGVLIKDRKKPEQSKVRIK